MHKKKKMHKKNLIYKLCQINKLTYKNIEEQFNLYKNLTFQTFHKVTNFCKVPTFVYSFSKKKNITFINKIEVIIRF